MTVLAELQSQKIVFFPVPKTACTSVKQAFYKINFGNYHVATEKCHIHIIYPTSGFIEVDRSIYADWTRLAVIRDPIERMLSAYSSRVLDHHELAEQAINLRLAGELGVRPDPSPDEFFVDLQKYRVLDISIRHHTEVATTFLGPDLGYFHRVYRMDQLRELFHFLSEQTGMEVKAVREHASAKKLVLQDLSPEARRALIEHCYSDYALMHGYYTPPE